MCTFSFTLCACVLTLIEHWICFLFVLNCFWFIAGPFPFFRGSLFTRDKLLWILGYWAAVIFGSKKSRLQHKHTCILHTGLTSVFYKYSSHTERALWPKWLGLIIAVTLVREALTWPKEILVSDWQVGVSLTDSAPVLVERYFNPDIDNLPPCLPSFVKNIFFRYLLLL